MEAMRVVELRDVASKESPLHYMREFNATAILESAGMRSELPLSFTVERRPVGGPDISVRFIEEPDWPLVPLLRSVKDMVLDLDKKGKLH
jgi:hypothetical protein